MTESNIGIAYCLIIVIHLIMIVVVRQVRRDFRDPVLDVARAVAWPITDALWLAEKWRAWRAASCPDKTRR